MKYFLKNNTPSAFLFSLSLVIVSVACHWHIFNRELAGIHVWRQSETQMNVLNFYRHDFNILNPRHNSLNDGDNILRYEFPIMQWSIAALFKVFGESILLTRICIFIIGLFSVLGFYKLSNYCFGNTTISALGAWAFNFSPVFYYYTMNPLPDNLALCAGIWSLVYFFKFYKSRKNVDVVWSAAFLSLATLAKLPFILFGAVVAGFVLYRLFEDFSANFKKILVIISIYIVFLIPPFLWYLWVIPTWHGNGVLAGIFDNKITLSHARLILKYHHDIMFPRILINPFAVPLFSLGTLLLIRTLAFKKELVVLWFCLTLSVTAYFLLELNMIDTVHDYYMMPFLPSLFMVVTYAIFQLWEIDKWVRAVVCALLVAMPWAAYQAVQNYWNVDMSGFNNDIFNYRNDLRKAAPQDALCIILNDHSNYIFPYQIDKRGHIFKDDTLPAAWVEDMIKRLGVTYMYSDSRKVDENPEVMKYFDSLVMERGTVRVFKLKKL